MLATTQPAAAGDAMLYAASDDWPLLFTEQDGRISGIGYDILTEVAKRTGDTIHISRLPVATDRKLTVEQVNRVVAKINSRPHASVWLERHHTKYIQG